MGRAILRVKGRLIVKYKDTARSSVQKSAEPMVMPFGLWARAGQRNQSCSPGSANVPSWDGKYD